MNPAKRPRRFPSSNATSFRSVESCPSMWTRTSPRSSTVTSMGISPSYVVNSPHQLPTAEARSGAEASVELSDCLPPAPAGPCTPSMLDRSSIPQLRSLVYQIRIIMACHFNWVRKVRDHLLGTYRTCTDSADSGEPPSRETSSRTPPDPPVETTSCSSSGNGTSRGCAKDSWLTSSSSIYERIRDHATEMEPNLHSEGTEYVLVNGDLAVHQGRLTGALACRCRGESHPTEWRGSPSEGRHPRR
jgi:hypothetical protein